MKDLEQYRDEWLAFFPGPGGQQHAFRVWNQVMKAYSEPHRHYHNLDHIRAMLDAFERSRAQLKDAAAVFVAILFHDFVYDPTRKDNEERSAALAETILKDLDYPEARIKKTASWIRATQHHTPNGDPDLDHLLDFDLQILGAEPEQYRQYTEQIRKEYELYPDALYRPGRKATMQHFLEREYIYATPHYRERFEATTRKNISNEIETL